MPQEPEAVELDDVGRAIFEDWRAAKEAAEAWRARQDELGALLIDRLDGKTRATIDGRQVVTHIPPGTGNRFDEKRFHENNPDLWADYVVPQYRGGFLRLPPKPRQ
jgi:hypothetical protein